VTNDHTDDDIRIVLDDDQRTYITQQKEIHRNEELEKWEIVTKNRHRTTDNKANEFSTDATNPNENNNYDNGIDMDDDTTNLKNEKHSELQKEQRDMLSGLAVATKKKRKKKKKNTKTSQCALPKPLHTIVKRSILEQNIEVEDMLMQYWHKIINLEDLIREKNKERTKMCAQMLLALHRKDTKIIEEIFDQRPEPMSCDLEPDIDIGHDYRRHEPKIGKFINNGIQRVEGLTSGWFSLQTD